MERTGLRVLKNTNKGFKIAAQKKIAKFIFIYSGDTLGILSCLSKP